MGFNIFKDIGGALFGKSPRVMGQQTAEQIEPKLPGVYQGNAPGVAGTQALTQTLQDPYGGGKWFANQGLSAANRAYDSARQRTRGANFASGAESGGVARAGTAGVETSRAANITDVLRNFDQYREQLGDARLATLLMPWLGAYNQGYGIASQQQTLPGQQGIIGDIIKGIASACWVARAVYGEESPRWREFRSWLFTKAPTWLFRAYIRFGPALGRVIAPRPWLRRALRPVLELPLRG